MRIYTIGYGGMTQDAFIACLLGAGVRLVADLTRKLELTVSRWCKTQRSSISCASRAKVIFPRTILDRRQSTPNLCCSCFLKIGVETIHRPPFLRHADG